METVELFVIVPDTKSISLFFSNSLILVNGPIMQLFDIERSEYTFAFINEPVHVVSNNVLFWHV